jgi:hypothetical protein
MAFIPVPNVVECDVIGMLFGQIIENTLYFLFPEEVLSSEVAQLASSVGEWAVAELCPLLSEDYTYLRTEATDISSAGQATHTSVTDTGTPGGSINPAAPGGTCIAISFRTALGGRSYRGRNYISGIPQVVLDGNQCTTVYADQIPVAYAALIPDYVADDLPQAQHVVVSRYHLGAPRAEGIATPITTYLLTNYDVDSQRRRLTGRGT